MRIGITCYPTYGGSGVVATELGIELAARGHDVHFISYAMPVRITEASARIHFHEVEMMNYPLFDHPPYTLALATAMANVAVNESLDLLHVHYAIPHSVSAYLARAMLKPRRLPFVTTLHGTDITLVGADRSYLPITRFSIEESDGVTAISEYLRDVTLREFDIHRPVEVIPNFVNCDVFRPADGKSRREEFAPRGEKVLVHLSNFRPVKRVSDVVEIFALVRQEIPAKLLMIGDGPDRTVAEWMVREKNVGSDVIFLGKQNQVQDLLNCADVLLLPSDIESFGLAALEGNGLRRPRHLLPRGRRAGSYPRWRGRLSGRGARRSNHGGAGPRNPYQSGTAGRDVACRPRSRPPPILQQEHHSALRRPLPARPQERLNAPK